MPFPTSFTPSSMDDTAFFVSVCMALDRVGDLFRGMARSLGQLPHLVRDDGKAPAVLPCPCCLDGGIEGEQVGLVGHIVDEPDYLADLVGSGTEALMTSDDSFTRSLMRFITVMVSLIMVSPVLTDRLASSELLTAVTQLWAISDEVFDISSLAVATESTCTAASSTPVAICSVALSRMWAADETSFLLWATWVIASWRLSAKALKWLAISPISSRLSTFTRLVKSPWDISSMTSTVLLTGATMVRVTKIGKEPGEQKGCAQDRGADDQHLLERFQ